jgi:hypothetical protein
MLNFTEEDQKTAAKLVQLIGLGKFTVDIQQNVELTKCLKFLQTLPAKIEANIFDQIEIVESDKVAPKAKKK